MAQESDNHKESNIKLVLAEWIQDLKRLIVDKKRMRFTVALTLLTFLATATLAAQIFRRDIASSGTIKVIGVGLFWDKACTSKVTSVTWGTITPGTSVSQYVYVLNDGTASGTLSMGYGNWTPASAASYITFAWNCSNYVLARSGIVCAKLTLTVQPSITGVKDFSFMIVIQTTG
jgi:hypothetical protein